MSDDYQGGQGRADAPDFDTPYASSPDAYDHNPEAYDYKREIRDMFKTPTTYSGQTRATHGEDSAAVYQPMRRRYNQDDGGTTYPWIGQAESDDDDGEDVCFGAPGSLPGNVATTPEAIENFTFAVSGGSGATLDIRIDSSDAYINFGTGGGNSGNDYSIGPSIAMEADGSATQIVLTDSGSNSVNINVNDVAEVMLSDSDGSNYIDILLDSSNNNLPKILLNSSSGSITSDFDSSQNPEIILDDGSGNSITSNFGSSGNPQWTLEDTDGNSVKAYIQTGDPEIEIQTEGGYSITLNGGCPSIEVNNGCTSTSISPTAIIINDNSSGGNGEVDIDSTDITSEAKFRSVTFVSSVTLSGTGCGCVTTKTGYFLCTATS